MHIIYSFLLLISLSIYSNANTVEESPVFVEEKVETPKEIFEKEKTKYIKKLLKSKASPSKLSYSLTKKYYRNFKYSTFFVDENGLKPMAFELLAQIKNDQVLKPNINKLFNLEEVEEQINLIASNEILNTLELIKTDFMLISIYHYYMRYLSRGLIDWEEFEKILAELNEEKEIIANWQKYNVRKNIRRLLYKAVKEDDINLAINEVNFTFPRTKELITYIEEYEQKALDGGFVKLPKVKKSLKKGNHYPEIKLLRKRLVEANYLADDLCMDNKVAINDINHNLQVKEEDKADFTNETPLPDCQEFYDEKLFDAVKLFQKNHGLVEDGIVGKNTIKILNTPIEEKIRKMRVNLERMRWMPRTLGEKYIIVNIPDYNLKMFNKDEKKLDMAVIVGKEHHPTPIFSHKVSEIVINPYWRIPQRIVRREIIPELVKDPEYLVKNDIKTFENWDHESMIYDTSAVDWTMYLDNDLIGTSKEAPMRFIQVPGGKNPLGRMKFLFPNRYSVYLHDTPFKHLFNRKKRALSHGCIRLSKPNELLKAIAKEDNLVEFKETQKILKEKEKSDFDLEKKIPVHIIYLTSWVDENGNLQFRDDIYNYDKIQGDILYKTNSHN